MGGLAAIGIAIIGAIGSAVAAIVSVVVAVVSAIASVLVAIGTIVWSSVCGLVVGGLEAFGVISATAGMNIMYSLGALNAVGAAVYSTVYVGITALAAAFKGFLTAIHFDVLMKIHRIAWILSEDYRKMMRNIFNSLAEFSKALGHTSEYMLLLLRNSRSVILDVSAMFGRGYDLGEVAWLQELRTYLQAIQHRGEKYADDPSKVLFDIDKLLDKPAYNTKASFWAGLLTSVDSLLESSDEVIKDVLKVKGDIDKLISDLPGFVKDRIKPEIDKVFGKLDGFIEDIYEPVIKKMESIIGVLSGEQLKAKAEIADLVDRLRKPGTLMRERIKLPTSERKREEDLIAEAANETVWWEMEDTREEKRKTQQRLDKVRKLLDRPIERNFYGTKEVLAPAGVSISDIEPENTWFVGDY